MAAAASRADQGIEIVALPAGFAEAVEMIRAAAIGWDGKDPLRGLG